MNMNQFAREVAKREGGKVNLSIAQIKEVLRVTREIIKEKSPTKMDLYLLIDRSVH